ncbi:MAG: MFS transporter [Deltaproteobacteria bacterium]|nr:MFS transporter [Deltaproteobacteria bacterium]
MLQPPVPGLARSTFAALRHRNYRLWFTGQLVSLLGSWMQITAQGFLVYQLTGSSIWLGTVTFAAGMPAWLFMLWGGAVADRVPRRTLLLVTQAAMILPASTLALLTFFDVVEAWHVAGLAFVTGVINAFDAPARQAFVPELVERGDLTNAIALNSTMFNSATALGPAMAGLAYTAWGPAWCFAINAASYLASLAALGLMLLPAPPPPRRSRAVPVEILEGIRFVAGHPDMRVLVGFVVLLSLFGISFSTLFPAWAVSVLHGDASTHGFLQSSRGAGALLGALFLAAVSRTIPRGRLLVAGTLLLPLAALVFAGVRQLPLAAAALLATGVGLILVLNLCNALLQSLSPDPLRGRVMSIYTLAFFGFMPLGGLLAGVLAAHLGEPAAVVLCAGVFLAAALAGRLLLPRLARLE